MAISSSLAPPRDIARRNEWALYIGTFFASLGFSFVGPLMPLLVLELLDGDQSLVGLWVGIAIGMSPALTALTGPWWGALSDRVGQKLMIQRALLSIGAAVALTAVIAHPWQLLGLRAVIGALGGISVACLAAITASSRRQTLGRNIGLLQAAQTLGQVAGPLVGGGLALATGLRPTFVISGLLFGLAFGLVTWLYRDVQRGTEPTTERRAAATKAPVREASLLFWSTLGVLFVANFLDGSFMVMLPLYLPQLGAAVDTVALLAGLGLSGGALAMALSSAQAGRLTSHIPTRRLILVMLSAAALVLLAILLANTWWQLLILRVLLGLVAGGLPTVAYAAAASQAPAERRGAVVGLASSAGLVGWAIAPVLVGLLYGINPGVVFALDFGLVVLCASVFWLASGGPRWSSLVRLRRQIRVPVQQLLADSEAT